MRKLRNRAKPRQIQPVMAFASAHIDEELSLGSLADHAGLSPYHMHRMFSAVAGETPKQFTSRLRLSRAAVMLLAGDKSILNVALDCGFQSHEAFCRAFRRTFGTTPGAYRARGFVAKLNTSQIEQHGALVNRIGPCTLLFRTTRNTELQRNDMEYPITKKQLSPQPVLMMRRRVKRSRIAAELGEMIGGSFQFAQRSGVALAGPPFTRILDWGPGVLTIEAGVQVAAAAAGEGDILSGTLPGGQAATTTHLGPYERLSETHAAIQEWIDDQDLVPAGPPWEVYVTDPTEVPDPADWKTEVFWPLAP